MILRSEGDSAFSNSKASDRAHEKGHCTSCDWRCPPISKEEPRKGALGTLSCVLTGTKDRVTAQCYEISLDLTGRSKIDSTPTGPRPRSPIDPPSSDESTPSQDVYDALMDDALMRWSTDKGWPDGRRLRLSSKKAPRVLVILVPCLPKLYPPSPRARS